MDRCVEQLLGANLGTIHIPGRIVLAPINTGFTREGRPTARLNRFHRVRSGTGIGISVVGNVAVASSGKTNHNTAVLSRENDRARFAVIARSIAKNGSLPGVQLSYSPSWLMPSRKWVCTSVDKEVSRLSRLFNQMCEGDISFILDSFVQSTKMASSCGYSVIQLHAAHGYFLSCMFEPTINSRSGYYSCRGPWLADFVSAIRSAHAGLLAIRLSLNSGIRDSNVELEDSISLARRLAGLGFHIFDWSNGHYTISRRDIYPAGECSSLKDHRVVKIASVIHAFHILNGGVRDYSMVYESPSNVLVGLGRPLLADPMLATKLVAGDERSLRSCKNTGRCHYFTRGSAFIECGVNSSLGRSGA